MKKSLFVFFLLTGMLSSTSWAQKFWLFFGDKGPEQSWFQEHPEGLLSPQALAKRQLRRIPLDQRDIPVSKTYIQQLRDAGMEIGRSSKWLNAVSVHTDLSFSEVQEICAQVVDMQPVASFVLHREENYHAVPDAWKQVSQTATIDYGQAAFQATQIGADCLHDQGFTGSGVVVAVFDAGFRNMDTIAAFDSLWATNRIVAYHDFVNNDNGVFDENSHGTGVASCVVANLPGSMVGTGPGVSLIMARTETVFQEVHQEEDNWLAAVEWVDSLGADVIQSSLGYTTFDPGEGDYTYQDMNGDVTIITRAADIAASKGIVVVSSAGNEGNSGWRHITAPCDADSILCVGAVNYNGDNASFSSVGPTADGRIKPDVMGLGAGTTIVGSAGQVTFGSGTSFAAPVVCGMVACLIQAHPQRSNMEVINAVIQSGDRYTTPDTIYGHGLPQACVADSILRVLDSLAASVSEPMAPEGVFNIYPNPVEDELVVEPIALGQKIQRIEVLMINGQEVMKLEYPQGQLDVQRISTAHLAEGMYILRLVTEDRQLFVHKFLKQQ